MWIAGYDIVNHPSDGSLRLLPNHLGIYATGSGYEWSSCPYYAAEFVAQSFPLAHEGALEMVVGETVEGWLELRNAGRASWIPGTTKLAPTPRDVGSPFHDPSWLSTVRIATVAAEVPPGATTRFAFRLTASAPGEFRQTFNLVQEGDTWFSDPPRGGGPADDFLAVRIVVTPRPGADADADTDDAGAAADADAGADAEAEMDSLSEVSSDGDATDVSPDGHAADADVEDAAPADASTPGGDSSGCGCRAVGAGSSEIAFVGWAACAAALLAVRRLRVRRRT